MVVDEDHLVVAHGVGYGGEPLSAGGDVLEDDTSDERLVGFELVERGVGVEEPVTGVVHLVEAGDVVGVGAAIALYVDAEDVGYCLAVTVESTCWEGFAVGVEGGFA